MKPDDRVETDITDVAYGGRGVARHEGEVLFIDGTLPGEAVRLRVTDCRRRYATATLVEVVRPSPDRITPACDLCDVRRPPAERCPGCCYQHADYAAELRLKHAQLAGLLQRIGRIQAPRVEAPFAAPHPLGYRNKLVLHADPDRAPPRLGYVAADNATVVDVPACPLAHPAIAAALSDLRARDGFLAGFGTARRFTLRWTAADGVRHWDGQAPTDRSLTESTAVGPVTVPAGSFFQVHPAVADALLREVEALLRGRPVDTAIDLYCGVGVFALAAARAGARRVIGIDSDAAAIRAARANAQAHGVADARFLAGPAVRVFRELARERDGAATAVIVDPPRAGLEAGVVTALAALRPALLVYVSCAADTLARDAARLNAAGIHLQSARVLDMFPRTAWFETLSVFAPGSV